MNAAGFYPGSFDPVTNGHLDIIERALKLFSRLVLGVGVHHGKTPLLDADARIAILERVVRPSAERIGSSLEIVTFDGLVVDAARSAGAPVLVRGLRDGSDFDYEHRMAAMNRTMADDVDTIYLSAAPDSAFISSSLVRQIARMGGDIEPFVPAASAEAVRAALAR